MKRLSSVLLAIFIIKSAFCQININLDNGQTIANNISTIATRTIQESSDAVIVQYDFSNASLLEDELYPGHYIWKIDGFGAEEEPTKPAVLYHTDNISIPNGCQAKFEILECNYIDINLPLTAARPPLSDSGNDIYDYSNVPFIDSSLGVFPTAVASLSCVSTYRGQKICNILVCPLQYLNSKTVRAYNKIIYKISFYNNARTKEIMPHYNIDKSFLANIVLNDSAIIHSDIANYSTLISRDYLIVSTSKYATAVSKISNWKKTLGYKVHTLVKEKWTGYEEVKDSILSIYNEFPSINYLLLIGDLEDVPSMFSELTVNGESREKHYTDYYYGCMSNDDNFSPDIFRGRLSVSTLEEANIVIDKIINYEKNPISDTAFYQTGVNCAQFQDDAINGFRDGMEDRRFTRTSEDIYNYLSSLGKDIKRIYYTEKGITPMSWSNYYADGEKIPIELQKPNFSWNGNATDINMALNNGAFYILHRDHGSISGWGAPSYYKTDIDNLNNGSKLPIVFSLNCNTGKFDSPVCFTEKFLRKYNGGCVAVYGASSISYSGYNDVLAGGMFDAIWPTPGLRIVYDKYTSSEPTPLPTYQLGQILDQGLSRMTEIYGKNTKVVKYTKEIFHCFGDPSMQIYTEIPTPFSDIKCIRGKESVEVTTKDESAFVSFFNMATDEVACYRGRHVIHKTNHPASILVTVSGHNKIPFSIEGTEESTTYIQNEKLTGNIIISDEIIKIGHNVTDQKEEGAVLIHDGNIKLQAKDVILKSNIIVNNCELIIESK